MVDKKKRRVRPRAEKPPAPKEARIGFDPGAGDDRTVIRTIYSEPEEPVGPNGGFVLGGDRVYRDVQQFVEGLTHSLPGVSMDIQVEHETRETGRHTLTTHTNATMCAELPLSMDAHVAALAMRSVAGAIMQANGFSQAVRRFLNGANENCGTFHHMDMVQVGIEIYVGILTELGLYVFDGMGAFLMRAQVQRGTPFEAVLFRTVGSIRRGLQ